LTKIWQWIAAEDGAAAQRLIRRIVEATDRLVKFPNSGAPRRRAHAAWSSAVTWFFIASALTASTSCASFTALAS
jgi:plasmid stabilization system protein ParE